MKRVRFYAHDRVAHIPMIGTKKTPATGKSRSYSAEELQLEILARKKIAWEHARGNIVRLNGKYVILKRMAKQAKAAGDGERFRACCEMMNSTMFEKILWTSKMVCMKLT